MKRLIATIEINDYDKFKRRWHENTVQYQRMKKVDEIWGDDLKEIIWNEVRGADNPEQAEQEIINELFEDKTYDFGDFNIDLK